MASTESLPDRLRRCIRLLRTGWFADGAAELNGCMLLLNRLLETKLLSETATERVLYSLETAIMLIEHQDWIGVADVIEYELVGLIDAAGIAA